MSEKSFLSKFVTILLYSSDRVAVSPSRPFDDDTAVREMWASEYGKYVSRANPSKVMLDSLRQNIWAEHVPATFLARWSWFMAFVGSAIVRNMYFPGPNDSWSRRFDSGSLKTAAEILGCD